jgi:signal transduction histidine kinase
MGRRFVWRIALALAAVVALAVAAGTLAAWLVGTALGSTPAPSWVRALAVAVLVVAVLGVIGAARGFSRIARPVGELVDAARQIEAGDYSVRVRERGPRDLRGVARAFNSMTARLETTESARRTFLADVAHELRTPLSVIRGQTESIADGVYPADAEHFSPILDATRTLEALVEDLRTLTLSEAGALRLTKEPVELGALMADVAAAFAPQAESARVALHANAADIPPIDADPVRLRAILTNLVGNAIAHTPAGGTVRMTAAATDGGVEVAVEDTGPGFPADLLPHIFDRFVKGPGSRGSGLGLAIARDLVEAHGGTIRAENRPGGGAAVKLTLPNR